MKVAPDVAATGALRPGRARSHGAVSRRLLRRAGRAALYLTLIVGSCVFLLPVVWMISSALKPNYEVFKFPPQWIPHPISWDNFYKALTFVPFDRFFLNTAIIAGATLVGSVGSNILIAYAFARLEARGRNALFYVVIATLLIPYVAVLIPQYLVFSHFGWVNTFWPLIVPAFFGNPFYIFLLREFFKGIPMDLEDAAAIDGAGPLRTLRSIIVPLSAPAVIVVCIFQVQYVWNDFLMPLMYLNSENHYTLQLGLQFFTGQYTGTWNLMMAASTAVLVPVLVIFYFGQRLFVKGVIVGALKG
jgi:multiple sugar transport system permease protein